MAPGVDGERRTRLPLGAGTRAQRLRLVGIEGPRASHLADDPGPHFGVVDPLGDVADDFGADVVLALVVHVRRVEVDKVVAASHHDVQAGFLGDAPQRERVAAKTDARHVDQRPAPHLLEDAGLVGGEVLIREHEVVEAPAPVHEHPRKGVEVYRSVGIGAPLRVLRLMKEPPQIHDQVLVHHGDAELLGRHGPEDRLRLPRNTRVPHRGLRCQPRWASVLPWTAKHIR